MDKTGIEFKINLFCSKIIKLLIKHMIQKFSKYSEYKKC